MIKRASPVVLRKALELAQLYVQMGVNFVAVPVTTEEEQAELAAQAIAKLAEIEKEAEGTANLVERDGVEGLPGRWTDADSKAYAYDRNLIDGC